MASLNPDDPTIPTSISDFAITSESASATRPSESFFMRELYEKIDSYALNARKSKVLNGEVASLTQELSTKGQLGPSDYEKLDQLASAAYRLNEANKLMNDAERDLDLYASRQFKEVLAAVPLIVEVEGIRVQVEAVRSGIGNEPRMRISAE